MMPCARHYNVLHPLCLKAAHPKLDGKEDVAQRNATSCYVVLPRPSPRTPRRKESLMQGMLVARCTPLGEILGRCRRS